jgi:hypothetical protein
MRLAVWLVIIALATAGHILADERFTAAIAPVVLVALWFGAPRSLRGAIALLAAALCCAGFVGGVALLVDVLPGAIAALIGWLFARSLLGTRQPLIARAIALIDGADPLADAAVRSYAVRLTLLWATAQFALAAFGLLCAGHAHWAIPARALPAPAVFGALILPLAVIVLFAAEFTLRPFVLPQAPRQPFFGFVRAMARAWPQLIED